MVYGSTTCTTAHDTNSMLVYKCKIYFSSCNLVLADDYGLIILPENEVIIVQAL